MTHGELTSKTLLSTKRDDPLSTGVHSNLLLPKKPSARSGTQKVRQIDASTAER